MVSSTLMFSLAVLLVDQHFSSATILGRTVHTAEKDSKCADVEKPDWTIGSLQNVPLDQWPWTCLNPTTLPGTVSSYCPDVFQAAINGYTGFVQYYAEKRGTALNLRDNSEDGDTPLHLAVKGGHLDTVKYITSKLDARDLNMYNDHFNTPLMYAAYYKQMDIVKYLLDEKKVDSSYRGSDQEDTLSLAARGGCVQIMKYLVDEKKFHATSNNARLLLSAAVGGSVDVLKYLIFEKGVEPFGTDYNHRDTALHKAAYWNQLDAAKFLVDDLNYKVNVKNAEGNTPSHCAAEGGGLSVLRYLMDERHAINIRSQNNYGHTLLHVAALNGNLDVVKYLVEEKGANIKAKDNTGKTPSEKAHGMAQQGKNDAKEVFAYLQKKMENNSTKT